MLYDGMIVIADRFDPAPCGGMASCMSDICKITAKTTTKTV
ncbi:hypothetical protein NOF55_20660 [Rhizobiaceae bacterium BDR2-2]|uniref:Uncharacterized protein n=1 Tax=Ectorhizobium quercum TaxID=2965071 RepID=A0AAE3N3H1_9HYPH|nr:hypothetical protein [Ectorhizobium quercum]MCX8999521.1 hypothetical protein [Ectorhizobium quercum]